MATGRDGPSSGSPRPADLAADERSLVHVVLSLLCARDEHEVLRHACVSAQLLAGADAAIVLEMQDRQLVERASLSCGAECRRVVQRLARRGTSPVRRAWESGRRQEGTVLLSTPRAPDGAAAQWAVLVEPLRDQDVTHVLLVLMWRCRGDRLLPPAPALPPVLGVAAGAALTRVGELRLLRSRTGVDPQTGLLATPAFRQIAVRVLARAAHARRQVSLLAACVEPVAEARRRSATSLDEEVLATVQRWRDVLRPLDLLARLDGDGFVVLLPGVDAPQTPGIAQRLRATCPRQVGAFLGAATTDGDQGLDALLDAARHDLSRRRRGSDEGN